MDDDGVGAPQCDLRRVFIHCSLAVAKIGHIFNYHLTEVWGEKRQVKKVVAAAAASIPTAARYTTPPSTYAVVGLLPRPIEYGVCPHHVIHHIALGDLLGAKLLWCREISSIVVTQMVVADDGDGLQGWRERQAIPGEKTQLSMFSGS